MSAKPTTRERIRAAAREIQEATRVAASIAPDPWIPAIAWLEEVIGRHLTPAPADNAGEQAEAFEGELATLRSVAERIEAGAVLSHENVAALLRSVAARLVRFAPTPADDGGVGRYCRNEAEWLRAFGSGDRLSDDDLGAMELLAERLERLALLRPAGDGGARERIELLDRMHDAWRRWKRAEDDEDDEEGSGADEAVEEMDYWGMAVNRLKVGLPVHMGRRPALLRPSVGGEGAEEALAAEILDELRRARAKFPGDNVTTLALVEEVGELAKATFEESRERVREEAVQVATMAMRVVLDGDHTLDAWRATKGLDPLLATPATGEREEGNHAG